MPKKEKKLSDKDKFIPLLEEKLLQISLMPGDDHISKLPYFVILLSTGSTIIIRPLEDSYGLYGQIYRRIVIIEFVQEEWVGVLSDRAKRKLDVLQLGTLEWRNNVGWLMVSMRGQNGILLVLSGDGDRSLTESLFFSVLHNIFR